MFINRLKLAIILSILLSISFPYASNCANSDDIKTSSPLYTDSTGFVENIAVKTVFRIICASKNRMGTGFLHKSGNVLTAAHVVDECEPNEVKILLPDRSIVSITKIIRDVDIDIAALTPSQTIDGKPLPLTVKNDILISAQVSTWGFPGGYNGRYPMLSVGYLSGKDVIETESGKTVARFVVNAAFNSGNSGGPLIEVESGSIIGIVTSKLAPIPKYIEEYLEALKRTEFGVIWDTTNSDGTKGTISQSQLLERILQYMRSQTQLVVGRAVLPEQIKKFLTDNSIKN